MSGGPEQEPTAPLRAAALSYQAQDAAARRAPRVVAKGQGALAEQIIRRAQENGVPIHESPELAQALTQLEVDQSIPPALFLVIAEVLAWAYRVEAEPATGVAGPAPGAASLPIG